MQSHGHHDPVETILISALIAVTALMVVLIVGPMLR